MTTEKLIDVGFNYLMICGALFQLVLIYWVIKGLFILFT